MEKNIETMLLLRALFLHLQNKENRKHLLWELNEVMHIDYLL
jgi:hypothetical protein